jgi:hypothetical protein
MMMSKMINTSEFRPRAEVTFFSYCRRGSNPFRRHVQQS